MSEFDAGNGVAAQTGRPPLNFSNVIDRVRRVLLGHTRLFLALGSIPAAALILSIGAIFGVLYALGWLAPGFKPDPLTIVWTFCPLMVASMLPMMVAYVLFEGAACAATLEVENGRVCSFSAAMTLAWRRLGRLVWLVTLRYLYVALPAIATIGVFALTVFTAGKHVSQIAPGVLFLLVPMAMLSYLGAMVYAVWMTIRLSVALPVSIAERRSGPDSLARSAELTRGNRGRIFLVLLVVYAISYAGMLVVEMAAFFVGSIGSLLGSMMGLHALNPVAIVLGILFGVAGAAAFLAVMILTWSSYSITCAVLYADRRQAEGVMESAPQPVVGGGPA